MRKTCLALVASAFMLGWSPQAKATISFDESAFGSGNNILLNTGQSDGTTLTGSLNTDPNYIVTFTSTQNLSSNPNGQALIEPVSPPLTNVTITPQTPVGKMLFNMFFGTGNATVTVHTDEAVHVQALGNGQNFLTITASNGEVITSVDISALDGFTDLRQVRIEQVPGEPVPEPASLT